tara:strand:- start:9431 stop:9652 length:222 start_codon:yes stop_codon:yes gene_type:complete
MGSIEKIYNELQKTKKHMNLVEQQAQFLQDRIDAMQRHHDKKMSQAMRIIRKLRRKQKPDQPKQKNYGQQLLG